MDALKEAYRLLECPVCLEVLRPPIQTCEQGHGICGDCRKRLNVCGLCKKNFTTASNTLFNQVLEKIPLQCKYNSLGCDKTAQFAEIQNHEKICSHRKVKCYFCKIDLPMFEMNDHFKNCNRLERLMSTFSTKKIIPCEVTEKEVYFSYYLIYITDIDTHFLMRFEDNRHETSFCVQYMGRDQENSGKYKYDIKINQGLPNSYVCYSDLCVPYTFSDQEIKQQKKRIRLDLDSVFLTKNPLLSKAYDIELTLGEVEAPNRLEKCIICSTEVPLQKMNDHFQICKPWDLLTTTFSTKEIIVCSIPDKEEYGNRLIYITNSQTYFLWRSITNRNKIAFCVQYMGKDHENAGKYKYDVQINQGSPNSFVCCSGLCVPYVYSNEEMKKQINIEINFLKNNDFSSKKLEITLNQLEASIPEVKCYKCHMEIPTSQINDHVKNCENSEKLETTFSKKKIIKCSMAKLEEDKHLIYVTDIQTHFLLRLVDYHEKTLLCVQYMGEDQENAGKYRYDIRINQGLPDFYVCCSGFCVPYTYSMKLTKKQKGKVALDLESIFLTDVFSPINFELELTLSAVKGSNSKPLFPVL